jgi:hypothetical protein
MVLWEKNLDLYGRLKLSVNKEDGVMGLTKHWEKGTL